MRIATLKILMILLSFTLIGECLAAATKSKDMSYIVIARDGTLHKTTVNYQLNITSDVWQTGRSAHGLSIQDTRNCHWKIYRSFERKLNRNVDLESGSERKLTSDLKRDLSKNLTSSENPSDLSENYGELMMSNPIVTFLNVIKAFDDNYGGEDSIDDYIFSSLYHIRDQVENIGEFIGRVFYLRTGINCGEAKDLIKADVKISEFEGGLIFERERHIDFYLGALKLYDDWEYVSSNHRRIRALLIIPESIYETPFHNLVVDSSAWQLYKTLVPELTDKEVFEKVSSINLASGDWGSLLLEEVLHDAVIKINANIEVEREPLEMWSNVIVDKFKPSKPLGGSLLASVNSNVLIGNPKLPTCLAGIDRGFYTLRAGENQDSEKAMEIAWGHLVSIVQPIENRVDRLEPLIEGLREEVGGNRIKSEFRSAKNQLEAIQHRVGGYVKYQQAKKACEENGHLQLELINSVRGGLVNPNAPRIINFPDSDFPGIPPSQLLLIKGLNFDVAE